MKISAILDQIDARTVALPEFQRGYVWNRDQVRGLFDSLYRRHPVGGLLIWETEANTARHRGDSALPSGMVKLLLDGQQRMTSLYGVVRGRPPEFFDGNAQAFTGLRFHLREERFEFYQPVKMRDDPLWVDVTEVMKKGAAGIGSYVQSLAADPQHAASMGDYVARLGRLLDILAIDLHAEHIIGTDKTLEIVVDIFNRVNSGGTKLSKGDLALAKICADWPEGRDKMKAELRRWESAQFEFTLDWLLRSMNTLATGESKFHHLHEKTSDEIRDALTRATRHIDSCLNQIANRLGLDHDRVLFGRFGIPVMVRYLDCRDTAPSLREWDKLLFWYLQAAMWGRFSGSVETFIDEDIETLGADGTDLDALLERLRLWRGGLRAEPAHFRGWGTGARFYPVLYLMTRMGEARDWGSGIPLKQRLLGRMSSLDVHHIFPKSQLYKKKLGKAEVNAVANFCFLTKDTNINISNRPPEDYFPEVEERFPGALASQWIPMDRALWKLGSYADFLEARRKLLAAELNKRLASLLHDDLRWLDGPAATVERAPVSFVGTTETDEDEDSQLDALGVWLGERGLASGHRAFDLSDADGNQVATLDLAWPRGLQEGLGQPIALLLNEEREVLTAANTAGYRCFTSVSAFKRFVNTEAGVPAEA
ncbi:MAG: DUF262 domain-containing protein [Planctomycetota bacterium]|nr:DUF262 domain-containing protein [Planctomycetota bacterium]